jgi:hypothetical protein
VNRHGSIGEVHGLPRYIFDEAMDEWAEGRGVLVKAIEDASLGMASVYRALELPLPVTLPYASKELKRRWAELVARIMPLDLVIDEHTADGREARVGKTSVAGSWGAVAGSLRYFADRFGVPRASIEGTTLSYDLIRSHAVWSHPEVWLVGDKKRQSLATARRLRYFGFELDAEVEPLAGPIPEQLRDAARDSLAAALVEGDTRHNDQGTLNRSIGQLRELWRRSGGTLFAASDDAIRVDLRRQLESVESWNDFLRTRLSLDPASRIPAEVRAPLDRLPGMVRLSGDAAPLEYRVENGKGVVRIRLREGQARRLRPDDLPELDRPVRFVVPRADEADVEAQTLDELREKLAAREPRRQRKTVQQTRRPRRRRA